MAINISARQLKDWRLPDDIRDGIVGAGITAHDVILEVTESMLLHDPGQVATVLWALKAEGVRIAIDDFGTGYSSLSHLQDLPVDILKIDKAFVSPVGDRMAGSETNNQRILGAILALGQTLGLEIVAEGIEAPEQAAALGAAGCDVGQGFLWSRPLAAVDATALLERLERAAASRAASTST